MYNMMEKYDYIRKNIQKIELVRVDGKWCLYNPFDLRIAEVDESCIDIVKKLKHMLDVKIDKKIIDFLFNFVKSDRIGETWNEIINKVLSIQNKKGYHGIVVFPSYDCNLKCIYCYANGGDRPKYLSWDLTRKAINYVFNNIRDTINSFVVVYHGGGEPTLNFKLIQKSYMYIKSLANKHDIDVLSHLGTNGVMSPKYASWLGEHIDRITISIDGPPEIHNAQRPMKNGEPSFEKVVNTINTLKETKTKISARSTITTLNVNRMEEIVDTVVDLGISKLHFETLTFEGRAKKLRDIRAPNPYLFVEKFIQAMNYAASRGAEIHYSGDRFGTIVPIFCNASGHNFCITPDGFITACYEVTKPNNNNGIFIYGLYDRNSKSFRIDEGKIGLLRNRVVTNIPACQSCFAKWHCGGGCMARALRKNGDIFVPDQTTCIITRELIRYYIKCILEGIPPLRKELFISICNIAVYNI